MKRKERDRNRCSSEEGRQKAKGQGTKSTCTTERAAHVIEVKEQLTRSHLNMTYAEGK